MNWIIKELGILLAGIFLCVIANMIDGYNEIIVLLLLHIMWDFNMKDI